MIEVYICAAKRTPQGSFGGALKGFSAVDLGVEAVKSAINAAGVLPEQVEEVFMGNVCSANLGQAPARQVALKSGIPNTAPCTTINKVCSSGMKAIFLGVQSIQLGINQVVVCGGMESMSNVPYYLPNHRWGSKYGNVEVVDGLSEDGLKDSFDQQAMGVYADAVSNEENISREDQDQYAIASYSKAKHAYDEGWLEDEIASIQIPQRKGAPITMTQDEEYSKVNFDKIPLLRPAFTKDGTATAANASTINDGASALVLVSKDFLKAHNLQPLAKVIGYADAGLAPEKFTVAPVEAAKQVLAQHPFSFDSVDVFEVNEAFSMVPLVFAKKCKVSLDKINTRGGAVSIGHPLGASGSRIVTTLVHAMHQQKLHTGLATICNGGGGASSLLLSTDF